MLRLEIPGSWYADVAGVAGDYAALMPNSHIQTSRGRVELPHGENVLYLRAALGTHGMRLCGQGHQSGLAWLWDSAWGSHGPAHGVSPCIFDADSRLHIATVAQGSQGYRYVAPGEVFVTGDATYNSQTPLALSYGLERIWEWTHLGSVTIGQGEACCLAIREERVLTPEHGFRMVRKRYVLEPGDCRFVRVQCVGNAYAVAIVKQLEQKAVLLWFQADELATLPLETTTPPVDPPIDPPIDPPVDPPIDPPETPVFTYNTTQLNNFAQSRWDALPHGTRHEQAAALFRILYEFRQHTGQSSQGHPEIEVFRKCTRQFDSDGNPLPMPCGTHFEGSDKHGYAEDICVIVQGDGKWWKDVGVAFGAPSASLNFGAGWQLTDQPQNCYPPPAPSGVVVPDPDPVDPPGDDLKARVEALEAKVVIQASGLAQITEIAKAVRVLEAVCKQLQDRVLELEQKPSGGGTFDPTKWKVETPVKFIGTSIGTIKPK